jgi:hypothetical protein
MSFDPGCTSMLSRTLAIAPIDAEQPVFHPEDASAARLRTPILSQMCETCRNNATSRLVRPGASSARPAGQICRKISRAARSPVSTAPSRKPWLLMDVLAGEVDPPLRGGSDGTIGCGVSDTHVRVGP